MDPVMLDMFRYADIQNKALDGTDVRKSHSDPDGQASFEDLLASSIKEVNSLQLEADAMINRLATGDVDDISEVTLASAKAEIALKLLVELRNKFVDAYQQLSRMTV